VHPDGKPDGGDPDQVALLARARSALIGAEREEYLGLRRFHQIQQELREIRERRHVSPERQAHWLGVEHERVAAEARAELEIEEARHVALAWDDADDPDLDEIEDIAEPERWVVEPRRRAAVAGDAARTDAVITAARVRVEAQIAASAARAQALYHHSLRRIELGRRRTVARALRPIAGPGDGIDELIRWSEANIRTLRRQLDGLLGRRS
jgi:hypothetical protein